MRATNKASRFALAATSAMLCWSFGVATSAQAMAPAPIPQPDVVVTQVALGCGPGRTLVGGVCVARSTIRHVRREVRRCRRWNGGVCAAWY